ncbi:MAG: helix-turn-helix domain-containing protein [Aggregatilineales bacterium]
MTDKIGLRLDRLRTIRAQRGLTQRELARRSDLSDSMIQKYESGINDPTSYTLKLIAEQLEVSVDYLLGMTDDPRIQVRDPSLDDNERAMLEVYRREGWTGVIRLGAERLSK